MTHVQKVAIFGASGNFGKPITTALLASGFALTIITRSNSPSQEFPPNVPVIRPEYTHKGLTEALGGQDAVISVIGPSGIQSEVTMVEAAYAAGVKRYIVNDFGWGYNEKSLPEFKDIGGLRRAAWDRANELAEKDRSEGKLGDGFTWTGISIGNPIDWAIKRFPLMGFDVSRRTACIYDAGTESFTGTTLSGIDQSVVGVLQHPNETANRFVKVKSIQTSQRDLLDAFQNAAQSKNEPEWGVEHSSVSKLLGSGRQKHREGKGGWILDLLVFQLYDPGQARSVVASQEDADDDLLGVAKESAAQIVDKVLTG